MRYYRHSIKIEILQQSINADVRIQEIRRYKQLEGNKDKEFSKQEAIDHKYNKRKAVTIIGTSKRESKANIGKTNSKSEEDN